MFAWLIIIVTIFLEGGGEAQVSHSLDVLGSQTGIPKGLKKSEIAKGRRVLTILEFGGHRSSSIWKFQWKGERG